MPTDKPTASAEQQDHISIPLSMLHTLPDVFRIAFDDKSLMPLVMSVQTKGVLKPILARIREDGECEIIDGYRRKRAAELAGLKTVPVQPVTESPELAKKLHLMTHGQLSPEKHPPLIQRPFESETHASCLFDFQKAYRYDLWKLWDQVLPFYFFEGYETDYE